MTDTTAYPERKLHVCHMSTVHPTFDRRVFYLECQSLAQAGHNVTLIVQANDDDYVRDGVRIRSLGKNAVPTAGLRLKQRLQRFARAFQLARRIKADIYHIHDPELIPLAIWLRLFTGAVVILDAHEDDIAYIRQKTYLNPVLRRLLMVFMGVNLRLAAHGLSAVVTADSGVADLFRRRYGAKRVIVAHNFPRLELFTVAEDATPVEQIYDLVYHGSIPRYHLEVTFKVAEELKQRGVRVTWLFFGNCPHLDWGNDEIQRRGLADYITLDATWIDHDRVLPRVRTARIGFIPLPDLPKFQHNIPAKLFEFMALNMPTVLSDLPPSRKFVGDGKCAIMVRPDDYTGYADAIIRLLTDEPLRRQMGLEARRRIEHEYNWQLEARKILRLYDELTR